MTTSIDMHALTDLRAQDRLIVALDVPSVDEALRAVERLPNVSFFKIGYQLFVTGGVPALLDALRDKHVFLDLKVPSDISNTIAAVIDVCVNAGVKFLTLSDSMAPAAIRAARATREARQSPTPKLLTVPFVSSLDAADLHEMSGERDLETHILRRAHRAIENGCDGIIASGDAIRICRQAFPHPIIIVSPGIRPAGAATNDHKRHTTPAEAIQLGADFLVVCRPILGSATPHETADRIIEEIQTALRPQSR
jgi:orotidine-5'-phosphate decarboxylase